MAISFTPVTCKHEDVTYMQAAWTLHGTPNNRRDSCFLFINIRTIKGATNTLFSLHVLAQEGMHPLFSTGHMSACSRN